MRGKTVLLGISIAVMVCVGAAAFADSAPVFVPDYEGIKELTFGVISTESQEALKKQWEPFLADMASALRIPVKAFYASDYAGVIVAMANKQLHMAWYGNKSAVEAVLQSKGNAEVIAQAVGKGRSTGYYSLLITHKDSPLNSLDDVIKNGKKLDFGNGDVNSTSGYLMPTAFLWSPRNIDPKKFFKTARNGSHETNIRAVIAKQVDFSTNNTEELAKLERNEPDNFKKIKILWKSPLIANDPIVIRKDLPRELKSAIQAFFLSYGRLGSDQEIARAREVLMSMTGSGYEPYFTSDNTQLIPYFKLKFAVLNKDTAAYKEIETLDSLVSKY